MGGRISCARFLSCHVQYNHFWRQIYSFQKGYHLKSINNKSIDIIPLKGNSFQKFIRTTLKFHNCQSLDDFDIFKWQILKLVKSIFPINNKYNWIELTNEMIWLIYLLNCRWLRRMKIQLKQIAKFDAMRRLTQPTLNVSNGNDSDFYI